LLSLTELRRARVALEASVSGHRIQAIAQPDEASIVLTTYGGRDAGRRRVRLSCRPDCARVSTPDGDAPGRGVEPGRFVQYLRSHLMGARVGGVRILDEDRQLALHLSAEAGEFELLLSILGPRSNLYLLDAAARLVMSFRPFAETRPELALGGPWRSPESRPRGEGDDRFAAEPDHRLLAAIEEHYSAVESQRSSEGLQRRVEQALRKETRGLDRKLAKLDESLAEARDAGRLEREGELLKTVLPQISRGDSEVIAEDFETGESVRIALDPKLSAADNLERHFKRYRKAVRSLTKAGARHDAVLAARAEIETLTRRFEEIAEAAASGDALEAFADEPAVRKLVRKYAPVAPADKGKPQTTERKLGKRTVPARLMPRRYRTAGGLEIWVGRSAAANDHLSLRLARGKDLFFHLDGAPGSHVILRTEGRGDPPSEAVIDACELAVHFSKQKNATRADVHAVPIANVRKPKGAKPGLVSVHGGKTIHLRRTPARLESVLAARIDDEA
jgi:predicted ribosome quality control (RQC) complex YloA/Tae2 family protein